MVNTVAVEILLGLPPLPLKINLETQAGISRLSCNEQQRSRSLMYGHIMKESYLQIGPDRMTLRYAFHKPFTVKLCDRSEWDRGIASVGKRELTWYTVGSKINEGTGAGAHDYGMGQRFSLA